MYVEERRRGYAEKDAILPQFYIRNGVVSDPKLYPTLGEREKSNTAGASGEQERLNCCVMNLRQKVLSHFSMVALSYSPLNAFSARYFTISGVNTFLPIFQMKKS